MYVYEKNEKCLYEYDINEYQQYEIEEINGLLEDENEPPVVIGKHIAKFYIDYENEKVMFDYTSNEKLIDIKILKELKIKYTDYVSEIEKIKKIRANYCILFASLKPDEIDATTMYTFEYTYTLLSNFYTCVESRDWIEDVYNSLKNQVD